MATPSKLEFNHQFPECLLVSLAKAVTPKSDTTGTNECCKLYADSVVESGLQSHYCVGATLKRMC